LTNYLYSDTLREEWKELTLGIVIVGSCAFYLFVRLFRRKESRKALHKIYDLEPREEARARRLEAARRPSYPDTTSGSYRRHNRQGLDIDLARGIWEDAG
jgi:hypothetical protein